MCALTIKYGNGQFPLQGRFFMVQSSPGRDSCALLPRLDDWEKIVHCGISCGSFNSKPPIGEWFWPLVKMVMSGGWFIFTMKYHRIIYH